MVAHCIFTEGDIFWGAKHIAKFAKEISVYLCEDSGIVSVLNMLILHNSNIKKNLNITFVS